MKTNENTSNIVVNIHNNSVYADFSYENMYLLNDSLTDTITKLSNSTPLKTKLNIKIKSKKDVKINESKFTNAFANTYANRISEKKHEILRCLATGFSILAFGIIFMLIALFVATDVNGIPNYIFNLLAWVGVWNSVEVLTVELIQLLIDKAKYIKIKSATLIFPKPKKRKKSTK